MGSEDNNCERMSDDLTIAYMLGVEDMRSKLHKQADEIERLRAENEKLHREAAIRIDQIEREQEAHLKTMAELNEQIASSQQLRYLIAKYSQQYVWMREALKPFAYYASQIPDDVSNTASASGTVGDLRAAAAAIRGSGE